MNLLQYICQGVVEENDKIAFVKYEMIKIMTDVIMTETEEIDEKLGNKASSQLTIPFKLAWNTMLFNKFIEKI